MIHRKITKTYLAVLSGFLDSPREVHDRLIRDGQKMMSRTSDEGVEAVSRFVPLAWIQGLTLAEVELGTGRTHQIRVHAQSLGHSLAGDRKYGGGAPPDELDRPWLLHAWKLSCDLFPAVTAPLEPRSALWVKKKFKFVL
jgi:23S rRNA-/tRNA-specific pseudouridylate synthase